jgi:hypothetical protein
VALRDKQYTLVLNALPASVKAALDCPPVQELINQGAKLNDLEACLAVEIARVANMLTVGGNLRQGQSVEIARTLIAEYPNESLQDFCLCLRNGMKGHYGDIFRFDILVIHQWIKAYLNEKCDALEERLMHEKDNQYQTVSAPLAQPKTTYTLVYDYPWIFAPVKDGKARRIAWEQRWDSMARPKPVPTISATDILLEGKLKPKAMVYRSTDLSYQKQLDERTRKGRELYFRENYPSASEEDLKRYLKSFE